MIDPLDLNIVTWVFDHLDELEWYEGSGGGCVSRFNGVGIMVSGSGISLTDGLKSCRVALPPMPKKTMDVKDHYQKKVVNMIMAIRSEATRQVVERLEDPEARQRVKDDLYKKLNGVW